ncbi:MAG: EFR1 family ferrodoxin [bacterium]|nr:EFR1 family ferrodoxin [bacterium]
MNTIFYFTGTGNSLQIAKDLAKELGDCTIRKIPEYKGEQVKADTVGIVFPVYNWGEPLIIKEFTKILNVSKNAYVYTIANYGGLPGKALDQCKEGLEKRKIKVYAGFLIHMPGNYIVWYEAYSKEKQEKLFEAEKQKVKQIAAMVKGRKEKRIEKSHAIVDRVFVNHYYKEVAGFHSQDSNFVLNNQCVGCGLCEKRCPVHNIKMVNGKPNWNHQCEQCFACIQSCPKQAIDYKEVTKGRKRYVNPNVSLA